MKKQHLILIAGLAMFTSSSCNAQNSSNGWQTNPNGLEYKFIVQGDGKQLPKPGDLGEFNVIHKIGDSVLINTLEIYGKPVPQQFQEPSIPGDLMEGLLMMKAGDSAIFRILADTLSARYKQPAAPWAKPGDYASWEIKMVSVKTKEQVEEENKQQGKAQAEVDDKIIQDYFKANNITNAQKTASGLYYVVHKEGSGSVPNSGQEVVVNYTGKLIDGTKFDSNVDPEFNHVEPFVFPVGAGRVIKGWDEGVLMMKKGEKRTYYIPSGLAYGNRSQGPIPENAVLIFDIELIDLK
jgi:FKBP-type peptidyl-prolyl cis-trans isomerase FkpA